MLPCCVSKMALLVVFRRMAINDHQQHSNRVGVVLGHWQVWKVGEFVHIDILVKFNLWRNFIVYLLRVTSVPVSFLQRRNALSSRSGSSLRNFSSLTILSISVLRKAFIPSCRPGNLEEHLLLNTFRSWLPTIIN